MNRFAALLIVLVSASSLRAQYEESLTVERILIDVRVIDFDGAPVLGLGAGDFTVRIGGRQAPIESVTWVDDLAAEEELVFVDRDGVPMTMTAPPRSRGRLFVLFVQTDFARNKPRVAGHMHFRRYAEELIGSLAPEDRIAVFSFDSHLKFRLDLTNDKEQVIEAFRETIWVDRPPPPPAVRTPSLAPRLDREAMRRAATSEDALLLVANALQEIPGAKSLLLLGWGLGERSRTMVYMRPKWKLVQRALDAARVSIFALDTTDADYHDLQAGLHRAAKDTGGFYAKTHLFPRVAVERLQRTLAGRYEIELRRPEKLRPGTHALDVRVSRRGTHVLAPSSWRDVARVEMTPLPPD